MWGEIEKMKEEGGSVRDCSHMFLISTPGPLDGASTL